jgi:hypothetical protein
MAIWDFSTEKLDGLSLKPLWSTKDRVRSDLKWTWAGIGYKEGCAGKREGGRNRQCVVARRRLNGHPEMCIRDQRCGTFYTPECNEADRCVRFKSRSVNPSVIHYNNKRNCVICVCTETESLLRYGRFAPAFQWRVLTLSAVIPIFNFLQPWHQQDVTTEQDEFDDFQCTYRQVFANMGTLT